MLAAQGAVVGVISAMVMLAIAMSALPLLDPETDAWTFTKGVSSVLLGPDAASPITGFEVAPFLIGALMHLTIGGIVGAVYGMLVALFDLEGWTPVALFGLLFGAMLSVWSTLIVGVGFASAGLSDHFPLTVMLGGNLAFGLTAGMGLATWADRADIDQTNGERVAVFEQDPPYVPPTSSLRVGD